MVKKRSLILISILMFVNGYTQSFNKEEFLYRAKTIYHSLRIQGLDNYSCWITSNLFLERTQKIYNQELYPLELIWKKPNQLYYIRRPIPILEDTLQNKQTETWRMDMLQAVKGIMIDWQRFNAGNILDEIPETYLVQARDDSVYINYDLFENGNTVKVAMLFGLNGICLKIKVSYPAIQEDIFTYPVFKLEGDKWLCTGWTVQTLKKGEIDSGFAVRLKSKNIENYWILERMALQVQQKDKKDTIYLREYIFKNILLNRELKFVQ